MEIHNLEEHLIKKYSNNFDFQQGFERCLGIRSKSLMLLKASIANDLDPNQKGINWWCAEKLDKTTNIIIADYLFSLPGSIEENLLNAFLYKVEVNLKTNKRNELFKNSIELTKDSHTQNTPATFEHYLNQTLLSRNASGFFTSIGSLLDCIAGLIIGVCGLEKNIITASFPKLIRDPEQGIHKSPLHKDPNFIKLNNLLERKNLEWAQWTLDLRNTYVHRSKRLNYEMLHPKPIEPLILNKYRRPILKTTTTRHLPKAPHLTEVEAMGIYKNKAIYLNEDQTVTIEGIWQDTVCFTDTVCELLIEIWSTRKNNKGLLNQPSSQWNNGNHIKERNKKGNWFEGYNPEDYKNVSNAKVAPELHFRMNVAGLSDSDNIIWEEFRKHYLNT